MEGREEIKKGRKFVSKCSRIRPIKKYPVCIPKIIVQTWKTKEVPEKWKTSPLSIQEIMPDWQYVLMTDDDNRNFVKKYFPDFLPYYDAFPYGIQRADAIRYMWLYIHGGIYMDLDFEVQADLSPLFQSGDIFLVKSGNVGSYFTNSFMASKPRMKFWLEMIERMKEELPWYCKIGKHLTVLSSTGPIGLSWVVADTKQTITIIPKKLVMPCSVCNIQCATCDSYLKPLEGSSWISYDTMFYNFWLCNWKTVIAFLICILILVLLFYVLKYIGIHQESIWPIHKCLSVICK